MTEEKEEFLNDAEGWQVRGRRLCDDSRHCKLALWICNVTLQLGKKPELCERWRGINKIELGLPSWTAWALQPTSWRGAEHSHTQELSSGRSTGATQK